MNEQFKIQDRIDAYIGDMVRKGAAYGHTVEILLKHFGDLRPPLTSEQVEEITEQVCEEIGAHYDGRGNRYADKGEEGLVRRILTRYATQQQDKSDPVDWKAKYEDAVTLGKKFESDSRKFFEQSCANLARAESAERERNEWKCQMHRLLNMCGLLMRHENDPAGMAGDVVCGAMNGVKRERDAAIERAEKAEARSQMPLAFMSMDADSGAVIAAQAIAIHRLSRRIAELE